LIAGPKHKLQHKSGVEDDPGKSFSLRYSQSSLVVMATTESNALRLGLAILLHQCSHHVVKMAFYGGVASYHPKQLSVLNHISQLKTQPNKQVVYRFISLSAERAVRRVGEAMPPLAFRSPAPILDRKPQEELVFLWRPHTPRFSCPYWDQPSDLAGINRRLLLGSTVGSITCN
jgi:hypothetical protein